MEVSDTKTNIYFQNATLKCKSHTNLTAESANNEDESSKRHFDLFQSSKRNLHTKARFHIQVQLHFQAHN